MKSNLTLPALRKTNIGAVLAKLYESKDLDHAQLTSLFKIALVLLNNNDINIRDLGYRILLRHGNHSGNFIPLYDIASQLGYIPILHLLRSRNLIPKNTRFLTLLMEAYSENFAVNGVYQTENQRQLFQSFEDANSISIAVVAPTSYGKSELIERTVEKNQKSNIAILVPSKALISQTRARVAKLVSEKNKFSIIIHHDMSFDLNEPVIAIMTQERLLRTYQKFPLLGFDILFVDEAHNLLDGDKRSRLLASAIMINKIRRPKCAVKFLTPFLSSSESLRLINDDVQVPELRISERLKTEDFFLCEIGSGLPTEIYDQFLDRFFIADTISHNNTIDFLIARQSSKNIAYLNKPKDIESFALRLSKSKGNVNSQNIEKICREIADYVHPQYKLLECLRSGISYHHGSVPDVVRNYVEQIFKEESSAAWIVTNSTLLEGVNIPAQTLFILDHRKGMGNLSLAQFRNLVGRVNRFSDVFHMDKGSTKLLLPKIFLVNCEYSRKKSNFHRYLSAVARIDRQATDSVENPLLHGVEYTEKVIKQRNDDFAFIENVEPMANLRDQPQICRTSIGRLCYAHNVFEIDIQQHEEIIASQVERLKITQQIITDANLLMTCIALVFISKLDENDTGRNTNLLRLRNSAAQKFYAMFFDWRINQMNYGRMIANFIAYWRKKAENDLDKFAYVGRWGNIVRDGHVENYVDLTVLSEYDMVNLAIVRIKEEQDFVDNTLLKFLEVFNEVGIVDIGLYNKVKYGTEDSDQIALIKNGFTHIAATTLIAKYRRFLKVDAADRISINAGILDSFKEKQEKELVIFEIQSSGFIK